MRNIASITRPVLLFSLFLSVIGFGSGLSACGIIATDNTISDDLTLATSTALDDQQTESQEITTLFDPFWEAWNIIHEMYIDQPLDDTKLMEGAIQGMVDALGDPNSGYMNARETENAYTVMEGEYDGIGAWVDTGSDYLTIISPMPDSPAEKVGLRTGDQVIVIDGVDVTGEDPELVRLKVLGPAGSKVVLTILRQDEQDPLDFEVTRAHITVPSVESEILEDEIGYVKLSLFGDNTAREFHDVLADFLAQEVKGIILDLRFNAGGYTDAATAVASQFITGKPIWYQEYGDGEREVHQAMPGGLAFDLPLVILVNEGSASASELVAGAVQDYERGQLVGVTTYGKGTVQSWEPLSNGGTVRVTIARWLTPNGRTIHGTGLTPDVIVEMTADDQTSGNDPQLAEAIQVLMDMIAENTP